MGGPDKQFDYDETLEKALAIFWEKGFFATSMQDLVDGMGISRSSMYQSYGNKQSLYSAAIDHYMQNTLGIVKDALEKTNNPMATLEVLLVSIIKASIKNNTSGCLINNAAVELSPFDESIATKTREFWQQFEALFSDLLKLAIDKGEIDQTVDTAQYAALINATFQGLIVKSKAHTPQKDLLKTLALLFQQIKLKK